VTSDLTFAYPLVRDGRVTARVITFNTVTKWDVLADPDVDPSVNGLWIADTTWEAYNVDCGYLYKGSIGAEGTYPGTLSPGPSSDIENC